MHNIVYNMKQLILFEGGCFMPIPIDHTKPVRTTAKLHAFNQLQQWIIDGTLQPDEKLNDIELAQALGVSRTPIRESLQLLESQGFVSMQPGRATQVTPVEPEDIYNLLPPLAALQALYIEQLMMVMIMIIVLKIILPFRLIRPHALECLFFMPWQQKCMVEL